VADLGAAHLSFRKTYCQAAGIALYERTLLHQSV
jgi:hypothetical protein